MNNRVQFIEADGRRAFAVVPIELWDQLSALAEELDDAALYRDATAADDGVRIPGAVAFAIAAGTHPVKAWREYRGLTQDALTERVGISKPFLSQIETGKRRFGAATLRALADALGVAADDLL